MRVELCTRGSFKVVQAFLKYMLILTLSIIIFIHILPHNYYKLLKTKRKSRHSERFWGSYRMGKHPGINFHLLANSTGQKQYEKYLLSAYPGSDDCDPPNGDLDLPKHWISGGKFSCNKHVTKDLTKEGYNVKRRQLEITCQGNTSESRVREVSGSRDLQTFRSPSQLSCLHRYVRQHCTDLRPVPDVIHLLWYGEATLHVRQMLGIYSIFTVARPCLVILHGDVTPSGHLWDAIVTSGQRLVRVYRKPSTRTPVSGRRIQKVQNQADLDRIQILIDFGGIYLDSDMVITRNLDTFRDVTFAASRAGAHRMLANGVMFSTPGNAILKEWLDQWQWYNGNAFISHSTLMLTDLANAHPNNMSVLGPVFIKFGFMNVRRLYKETCSLGDSFGAHLYTKRFEDHLKEYIHKHLNARPGSLTTKQRQDLEIEYIKTINTTYGRLGRFVLFGDSALCT